MIAKYYGATLEQVNDHLIIQGMEKGFLDLLKKQYSDLTPLLQQAFAYDSETEKWHLKKMSSSEATSTSTCGLSISCEVT